MTSHPTLPRKLALLVAALLLVSAPALLAQVPTEGYDPMRQITAQLQKANLQIVLDVTGSMARYPDRSDSPPFAGLGHLDWSGATGSGSCSGSGSSTTCKYWDYKLTFYAPSRIAVVKNALGNSVPIVTEFAPPSVPPAGWTKSDGTTTGSVRDWTYRFTYATTGRDPGAPPFTPFEQITIAGTSPAYKVDNFPIVRNGACLTAASNGTACTCTYVPPNDLIGRNKNRVNWGLMSFATNRTGGDVQTHVVIDVTDQNTNLARLEDYLLPAGATGATGVKGLGLGTYTPTKAAMAGAKTAIENALAIDPRGGCNRPYGVVLVTDGLSNSGNPGGGNGSNWINPCDVPGVIQTTCDTFEGSDCPSNWGNYAAYGADQLYRSTSVTQTIAPFATVSSRVRTWTIGVSTQVGPCELDFIAYMGRTDADSPSGDAGFGGYDATKNPYLPVTDTSEPTDPRYSSSSNYDGPSGQYKWNKDSAVSFDAALAGYGTPQRKAHGHNAFFATTASALASALTAIVNATGTGDYATNAPVSGQAANLSNVIYLPSTGFPDWTGHIYAFDTLVPATIPDPLDTGTPPRQIPNPAYLKWDAGLVLNGRSSSLRKIFTWDPNSTPPNALVEVTSTNRATIQGIPGGAGVTDAVIDFIRGNNGAGTPRTWRLGPMINSAPALVGAPSIWRQATTVSHRPFESQYASRTALLWVGSDDGMLHAFRITDGVEQIALVPPSLLAKQAQLYANYVADTRNPKNPSGEPPDTDAHLYGVANSLRFGDVWFATPNSYKTVGVLTLGGGGNDVIAFDVTSVPAPDASPYPASPVSILWTKNASTLTGLQQSWSMPAMAPVAADTFRLIMGSGFRPANTRSAQTTNTNFVAPATFTLDPTDGSILQTNTLSSLNSPAPMVGNQAFADAVLFAPTSRFYQEDNIAQLALQADLNGRIWFLYNSGNQSGFAATRIGIDATTKSGQSQPIYYNPAASGYASGLAGCVAYAFGSGTLYERSALVTGAGVGTTGFIPRVYVATADKSSMTAAVPAANIVSKAISSAWCVANCDAVDPNARTYKTFGPKTQLTAPPFMLVPRNLSTTGSNSLTALFLLYDPDEGCTGHSYVARVEFIGNDSCVPTNVAYTAYDAGIGAASGFTIADSRVLVSKSGIGQGQRASIFEPPNISASVGGTVTPKVKWWKELK